MWPCLRPMALDHHLILLQRQIPPCFPRAPFLFPCRLTSWIVHGKRLTESMADLLSPTISLSRLTVSCSIPIRGAPISCVCIAPTGRGLAGLSKATTYTARRQTVSTCMPNTSRSSIRRRENEWSLSALHLSENQYSVVLFFMFFLLYPIRGKGDVMFVSSRKTIKAFLFYAAEKLRWFL